MEWPRVFDSDKLHRAEIVKAVLIDREIKALIVSKKDSVYDNFGYHHVHVEPANVMLALKIIQDEINFE